MSGYGYQCNIQHLTASTIHDTLIHQFYKESAMVNTPKKKTMKFEVTVEVFPEVENKQAADFIRNAIYGETYSISTIIYKPENPKSIRVRRIAI